MITDFSTRKRRLYGTKKKTDVSAKFCYATSMFAVAFFIANVVYTISN